MVIEPIDIKVDNLLGRRIKTKEQTDIGRLNIRMAKLKKELSEQSVQLTKMDITLNHQKVFFENFVFSLHGILESFMRWYEDSLPIEEKLEWKKYKGGYKK